MTVPPPLVRIAQIDAELTSLYERARVLLDERAWLVSRLARPPIVGPAAPGAASGPGAPGGPSGPPRRETSPVTAQTLLLVLGGLLLGTASIVFAVVAWNRSGVAGRALVLLTLTVAALLLPAILLRRRLAATAETLAAVGLLLAVLDGYAAWRLDLLGVRGLDSWAYAAGVVAVLAAGWAGYGAALPLRGPRPTAVALAALPLPLLAVAAGPTPAGLALALLGSVPLDLLLRRARSAAVRRVAAVAGGSSWVLAVLVAVPAAYTPGWTAAAVGALAGAVALGVAGLLAAGPRRDVLTGAGLLVLVAVAVGVLRDLPGDLALLVAALLGLGLAGLAAGLPAAWRRGPLGAGAVVLGLTGTVPATAALGALAVPVGTAALPWRGDAAVPAELAAAATPTVLLVGLVVAGGGALLAAVLGRRALVPVAAAAGLLAAALLAPVALSLPLAAVLAGLGAATVVTAGLAAGGRFVRGPAAGRVAGRVAALVGGLALGLAGLAVAWSLASRPATLAVLAGLAVLAAAVAGAGRRLDVRAGAAATGVLALAGEAAAVPLAADAPVRAAAFVLLGAVAGAAGTAAAVRRHRPVEAVAVELAAVLPAVAALGLAATRGWTASLAFGLLGAVLAAAALRPDRRPLGWAGAASVQVAGWIALATAEVTAPEAYTLPLTGLLLGIGLLRRRSGGSSWTAYAPGLLVTALPSVATALAGGDWRRPLLLGTGALAVVLIGARARLQAPLAIGAATLLALALHEVGPVLLGVVDDLPRWLPPAVGGTLLIAVGSTYERRLRDLRRVRAAFERLA